MVEITTLLGNVNQFLLGAAGQPWVYAAVVIACLIDGFFPPFPSETIVVGLASLTAAQGPPGWLPLLLAAALGAFAGDNIAYAIGRGLASRRFSWTEKPRMRRSLSRVGLELERRAVPVMLSARFIPVGRVAVNLGAGATRYPHRRFAAITALSSLMWASYTVAIGAFAGTWIHGNPLLGAVAAVVLAVVVGLAVERFARRSGKVGPARETPVLESADSLQ